MSVTTRDGWVLVGVLLLIVAGAGLVVASPPESTGPPPRSGSVGDCELVQLAVYELDGEPPGDSEQKQYRSLSGIQQAVVDEGRAANGDFVRFHDGDRMVAADALPPYVVFDDRTYRAHSIRGNCFERPWYAGLVEPTGYLLVAIGILAGSAFVWRHISY